MRRELKLRRVLNENLFANEKPLRWRGWREDQRFDRAIGQLDDYLVSRRRRGNIPLPQRLHHCPQSLSAGDLAHNQNFTPQSGAGARHSLGGGWRRGTGAASQTTG